MLTKLTTQLTYVKLIFNSSLLLANNLVLYGCPLSGPASPPTGLSVECDSSSAVVSFQSPVYGGECVDHYVVTAVSEEEERNVSCSYTTSDEQVYNCRISLHGNTSDYSFTVYGVTQVNSSFSYNGSKATSCCKFFLSLTSANFSYLITGVLFPNNISVTEGECGHINIFWEVSMD